MNINLKNTNDDIFINKPGGESIGVYTYLINSKMFVETPEEEIVTSLTCENNKYYRLNTPVDTLNIILPQDVSGTDIKNVLIYLTTGNSPAITISSALNIYYLSDYEIEANSTYEINCLYNDATWVITRVEIIVQNNNGE